MNKALERVPLSRQHASVAHLVERHLAKVEVASSSLVARSTENAHTILCGHSQWKRKFKKAVDISVQTAYNKIEATVT